MRCVAVHEHPSNLSDDGQDSRPAAGCKDLQKSVEVQAIAPGRMFTCKLTSSTWKVTQAHCQVCLHLRIDLSPELFRPGPCNQFLKPIFH